MLLTYIFKQGPALYAHNNARFTEEDWMGIRLVCDSIKVEDPMKVGRFGLGFKSVFHMTGRPSKLKMISTIYRYTIKYNKMTLVYTIAVWAGAQ